MNWNIEFFIWLKEAGIFGVCCIPFVELGLRAFSIGLMISWIVIPVYTLSLWIIKKARTPYKPSTGLMLLVPTVSSVLTALCFLHFADTGVVSDGETILFWVPLFCCLLSATFYVNRIFCYRHPQAVPEFIIE